MSGSGRVSENEWEREWEKWEREREWLSGSG